MWLQQPIAGLEREIERTRQVALRLLSAYVEWGDRIQHGPNYFTSYGDAIDFANFRMETAGSCLRLIEDGRVADAFGLGRSLLENYMLFILMCRGEKYPQVVDLQDKKPQEFAEILKEQREALAAEQVAGVTSCIDIRKHPRRSRVLMYIYDGLRTTDGAPLPLSYYFFQFQDFRPEVMRLKHDDYFEYYEAGDELRKALKQHRREALGRYSFFLSYDALIDGLELNGILDEQSRLRLDAHYTFLGKYVHPTSDAVRELHYRARSHSGKPAVGMGDAYTQTSRLLALSYTVHLIAGYLSELAQLFERGVARGEIQDAGTSSLRARIDDASRATSYFWFIFNEATPFARFEWAVNLATDAELEEYDSYLSVPSERIKFDQNIYGSFERSLLGWSNRRVGSYRSPIVELDQA